jgi:UDP-N-acetylmuramate--alanine ligase
VDASNPEVVEARRLLIPVIPRGELLAELMRLKYGIAIAGSHGKTTTTSMTATVLHVAGLDPTVVVGGKAASMGGSNARVGHSDFLVVESDESDGSFLKLSPILAITIRPSSRFARRSWSSFKRFRSTERPSCAWMTKTSSSFSPW